MSTCETGIQLQRLAGLRHRFIVSTCSKKLPSQARSEHRRKWIQFDGLLLGLNGVIELPEHRFHPRQLVVSQGQLGIQLQGTFDFLFAAVPIEGTGESDAQREMRVGEIGVQGQCLLRHFLFFGPEFLARQQAAHPAVVVSQSAISERVRRIQLQGLIEILQGVALSGH